MRSPGRRKSNRRPSRLIVGLGNPGRRYARTFHNAGFAAVEQLARALAIRLIPEGEAECGAGDAGGSTVLLVRPQGYMNRSGAAVAPLYRAYAGSPEDLVVIHDDLDIPLGEVRLKRGGGTGGHNGLRSLQEDLGTRDFLRIRVGIGRPPEGVDPADFVLSPVPAERRELFLGGVASAAEAAMEVLRDGFDKAMTRRNVRRSEARPQPAGADILLAPGEESGGSNSRKEAKKRDADEV